MKVLAFDQATAKTGWACGDERQDRKSYDFGSIVIPKRQHFGERLAHQYGVMVKLIEGHKPDTIACEEPFFPVDRSAFAGPKVVSRSALLPDESPAAGGRGAAFNLETAKQLQMVKGMVMLLAAQYGLQLYSYTPSQWRGTVLGFGRAPRGPEAPDMKRLVRRRIEAIGYEVGPDDEAEAIGILMHALHGPDAAARAQGDLLSMVADRVRR